jgi:hypothetical protein
VDLKQATEEKAHDVEIVVTGTVVRLLKDDTEGTEHQRWILEDDFGDTVMVVHNISRFERLSGVEEGEKMEVKGLYSWDEHGGYIHRVHERLHGHDGEDGYVRIVKSKE